MARIESGIESGDSVAATTTGARIELGFDCHVEHLRGFIPAAQAHQLHQALEAELRWEERSIVLFGRRILQPRLVAWAGQVPYRYSGQTLPPRPFTPAVADLLERVATRVVAPFNHVLANRYRHGQDSMGQHADAESELGPDPLVATLSFGATRPLVVVPRKGLPGARPGDRRVFHLASGDLFVMGGACQRHFRHGIPRVAGLTEERVSLTFRNVLRAPPG
jgi:alkylated DNA repair dioxygenase AlkB